MVEIDITTGEKKILATLGGKNDNLAFDSTGRLFVSSTTAATDGAIHEFLADGSVRALG